MKINRFVSQNYSKKTRLFSDIKAIIVHYTGMQSTRESLKRLCNSRSKVSCHYLINHSGKIFQLVKDKHVAWHAGKSKWIKYKNLNKYSIGIELVNRGHKYGYTNFNKKQILNLIKLCKKLRLKYKIVKQNIVGHSDIAPLRKIDPGEKFPWKYLAKNNIGIWHDLKSSTLINCRDLKVIKYYDDKKNFIRNLKKIGYHINLNSDKKTFFKTTKAFQMHFRKELINGLLDMECLKIAKNLAKKL